MVCLSTEVIHLLISEVFSHIRFSLPISRVAENFCMVRSIEYKKLSGKREHI